MCVAFRQKWIKVCRCNCVTLSLKMVWRVEKCGRLFLDNTIWCTVVVGRCVRGLLLHHTSCMCFYTLWLILILIIVITIQMLPSHRRRALCAWAAAAPHFLRVLLHPLANANPNYFNYYTIKLLPSHRRRALCAWAAAAPHILHVLLHPLANPNTNYFIIILNATIPSPQGAVCVGCCCTSLPACAFTPSG